MSKLGIAIGIGPASSASARDWPAMGGLWAEERMRWGFSISIPLGLGVFLGTLLLIRESRSDIEDRLLDLSEPISAVALFALTYGLLKATSSAGVTCARSAALRLGGVIGLAAFVADEWYVLPDARSRPLRSQTFAAPTRSPSSSIVLFGLLFLGALFIQSIMGFSATEAGLSQPPMMAMIIVSARKSASWSGRSVRGRCSRWAWRCWPSLFLLSSTASTSTRTSGRSCGHGGRVIGFAAASIPPTAAALSAVPFQQAGMGAAAINSMRQIGGALGLAVMGAISAELVAAGLGRERPRPTPSWTASRSDATGAGVAATASVVAWIMIVRPARAARAAAAAAVRPRRRPSPRPLPRRRRLRRPSGRT